MKYEEACLAQEKDENIYGIKDHEILPLTITSLGRNEVREKILNGNEYVVAIEYVEWCVTRSNYDPVTETATTYDMALSDLFITPDEAKKRLEEIIILETKSLNETFIINNIRKEIIVIDITGSNKKGIK